MTHHFDVLIVGAGLSGIGMAHHLTERCPDKSYAILEARASMGGTWDLFRYPGIRSDSDMHTLSYNFHPWYGDKSLADGPSILEYIKDTAQHDETDKNIHYNCKAKSATWSSENARWTVEATRTDTGEKEIFTCNFLQMCAGYYSYREGYKPAIAGQESFQGEMLYPQQWPEDYDATGKRILVIGSGATAVTLVPALAETAKHVVMLQRSPTYVVSVPDKDIIAHFLRRIMPLSWAQKITRWKTIRLEKHIYELSREKPEKVKKQILKWARKKLNDDFDIDKHFSPRYNPWDQRMCLIPNDDLFEAINEDRASVVTDEIDTITEAGVRLKSGEEIEADAIVMATGLNVVMLGEVAFDVDGAPVDFAKTWIYKGLMYSGVPNLSGTFGYINASWTLRADIQATFVCRLINHLDQIGMRQATPTLRASDKNMQPRPIIENFSSGYIQRAVPLMPQQGDRAPWQNKQSYKHEKPILVQQPIDDDAMAFSHPVDSLSEDRQPPRADGAPRIGDNSSQRRMASDPPAITAAE